ncbi:hypothetical protein ACFQ2B_07755 [Streptomyces stramineus]
MLAHGAVLYRTAVDRKPPCCPGSTSCASRSSATGRCCPSKPSRSSPSS